MVYPVGYSAIPGGIFTPRGAQAPVEVAPFGMKQTPVTNGEYSDLTRTLLADRYVLLDYDFECGATRLIRQGRTAAIAANGPSYAPRSIDFGRGEILILGTQILLKMVDFPSDQYDEADRLFSGFMQPAVAVTYFHAKAWCLFKSLEADGSYYYDLPTDEQYEFVASDRGTKKYGTETGTLYDASGRRLAHVNQGLKGTTATVDDPRYEQNLPFAVQTTGNVWRWMQMNPAFRRKDDFFSGPYGIRGGSWCDVEDRGMVDTRHRGFPAYTFSSDFGFQPVVIPNQARVV